MKTGTKSVLFGVHQFLWHPITVWMAWVWLYRKFPTWKEAVCIFIHDLGYWGKDKMDDEDGETHPEWAAGWALDHFDKYEWGAPYSDLCLYHSRHYARKHNREPSKLCWPDKLSIMFEPWWLYLPRAWASGELAEYRAIAATAGFIPLSATHREWYSWIKDRLRKLAEEKRGDAVPYVNALRGSGKDL